MNLSRKIQLQDGTRLCTLDDALSYLNNLPEDDRQRSLWQTANGRLMAAAEGRGRIERATDAIYRALFLEGKLKGKRTEAQREIIDRAT